MYLLQIRWNSVVNVRSLHLVYSQEMNIITLSPDPTLEQAPPPHLLPSHSHDVCVYSNHSGMNKGNLIGCKCVVCCQVY